MERPSMSTFENAASRGGKYVVRLPVLTKGVLVICSALYVISRAFDIIPILDLDPNRMTIFELHRLNTFPIVHLDIFHIILNLLALTPMLSGFEKEKGTLYTLLMILGPFSTFPAILYLAIQYLILHWNTPILGSSVWVFLFLAIEAMKAYKQNPFYNVLSYKIPTWSTPFVLLVLVEILFPKSASFLGHLCALAVGYAYSLSYIRLFEPSEKILNLVESKLNFILFRIPFYISLEKRDSDGENGPSFLPVNSRSNSVSEGTITEESPFGGHGRTLGS